MQLKKITLEGKRVRLEPLEPHHRDGMARAIEDGALWEIPVTIVPHPSDLDRFFEQAEAAFQAGRELAFATVNKISGAIVGSTRFRCIEPAHKRAEIGFTFLAQSAQRTFVNTEAKYLMLQHAFANWELNRVELLTDVLNQKSRNAIARIGAKEEGVLRSHMVMRGGRVRDSVLFSITRNEWPAVSEALCARIASQ